MQNTNTQQSVDYLLPRSAIQKLAGLSRASIYRGIAAGTFPRPVALPSGGVRWRQSDIIAWQQSLSVTAQGRNMTATTSNLADSRQKFNCAGSFFR